MHKQTPRDTDHRTGGAERPREKTVPNIAELEAAYRSATYCLDTEEGRFVLSIERPTPALAAWMQRTRLHRLVLLTACNPGSRSLDTNVNAQRHRELLRVVDELNLRAWPAVSRDPQGHWPDEPGLGIAEFEDARLDLWLNRFEQNAAVGIEPPDPPRLIWHPSLRKPPPGP